MDKAFSKLCHGPLDFPMEDFDAKELERKLDTGEYSPFRRFSSEFESFFPNERADISVISDGSIDEEGDVVDPKGLDWSKYQKNPLVTFGHNYNIAPIGRSMWQKLIADFTWKAKTQYIPKPKDYPTEKEWFPDSIYHMIKEGFLPGKSIGGITKWIKDETGKAKRIATKSIIYEYSVVPRQANNNAIVEAVSKGLVFFPEEVLSDFPEVYNIIKEQKCKEEEFKNSLPIIKDLDKCPSNILTCLWIEDCQHLDKISVILPYFKSVIFSVKQRKVAIQYLNKFPKLLIGFLDHYIDHHTFYDYKLPKIYDIVFYGYVNRQYLFRWRLLNLLLKNKHLFRLKYIPHPGYYHLENKKTITGTDLAKVLNS